MMSMKLMKWVAAGVLAGAPAIGFARAHHVTAAAPLSAISSMSSKISPAKLATAHRKLASKAHVKAARTIRKVVKHTAKPKVSHKRHAKVKSKKH
jgi:hypothetical protein